MKFSLIYLFNDLMAVLVTTSHLRLKFFPVYSFCFGSLTCFILSLRVHSLGEVRCDGNVDLNDLDVNCGVSETCV